MPMLSTLYAKLHKYALAYYPDDLGEGFWVWAQEDQGSGPSEWGTDEDEDSGPNIDWDSPSYVNYETQAVAEFVANNAKIGKKLKALAKEEFDKTHSIANIEYVVSSYLYNFIANGVSKLSAPYSDLVHAAMGNVSWDSITSLYSDSFSGPVYEDEDSYLQDLMQQFSLDDTPVQNDQQGYYDNSGHFIPYPTHDQIPPVG